MRLTITVNGQEATLSATTDLRPHWQALRARRFSEVWLDAGEDGSLLAMLVNGQRAWLMYMRDHDGDPGLTSRNPDYAGPPDARMEFVLDNGQLDHYPIAWTLHLEQALAACEYFVATKGGRSPDVVWHDDAINNQP